MAIPLWKQIFTQKVDLDVLRHQAESGPGKFEAKVRSPEEAVVSARESLVPKLTGEDSREQIYIDGLLREIDGTFDFSTIGANVAVAVSLANAKAAASSLGIELYNYLGGAFVIDTPFPLGNVIGGGAHAANATEIQEFLVVPTGASGAKEAVFANAAVHRKVRDLLKARDKPSGKGDEGAWAPEITESRGIRDCKGSDRSCLR